MTPEQWTIEALKILTPVSEAIEKMWLEQDARWLQTILDWHSQQKTYSP